MSTVTIVIQNAPYKDNNKAWHALRFAGAALVEDMKVQVHLLDDGVEVGRKNHDVPERAVNVDWKSVPAACHWVNVPWMKMQ